MKKFSLVFVVILFIVTCKTDDNTVIDNNDNNNNEVIVNVDNTNTVVDNSNTEVVVNTTDNSLPLEDRIRQLFYDIEGYVSSGNYQGWYNNLSNKYKTYLNNSSELRRLSEMADFLVRNNIILTNSRDYFEHVVIKSRGGLPMSVERINIINSTQVVVLCKLGDSTGYSYTFIFEDGKWKVDF